MAVKSAVAVGTCRSILRQPGPAYATVFGAAASAGQAFASPAALPHAALIPGYLCLSRCPPRRGKADSSDMDILICLPPSLPDEDCGELLTEVGGRGWQGGRQAPRLQFVAPRCCQHLLRTTCSMD